MVDHNNNNDNRYNNNYQRKQSLSDKIVPVAVFSLSLGALALSVYAINGGPVDNYVAGRYQQQLVAYAEAEDVQGTESDDIDNISEVVGKGHYDVTVQVDEDGKRQYVLTPIESDETDGEDSETDDDVESKDDAESDEDTDSKDDDDKSEDPTEETADEEDTSEDSEESDDDSELSEEDQAELDDHMSMRLRIRPDRDGEDLYYYVVESGDTLHDISVNFGIPLGQLMEDNYIEDSDMIYVGEVIFMPTGFEK